MVVISKLQRNPKDIYQEASRLLIKIAENILQDPSNQKLRTLQKSNTTISNKVLNVFGGIDCLLLMGFEDRSSCLTLPSEASLDKLKKVKDDIIKYQKLYYENNGATPRANPRVQVNEEPEDIIKKIELPPFKKKYANDFLNKIAYHFHLAQIHDNKELHARALKLIPVRQLEVNALEDLRVLQKELKNGEVEHSNVMMQDMMLLELLQWFKNDFFSWVDSPPCENCSGATKFSHMSHDVNLLKYTDRVEMHQCQTCNAYTPFPRYNDLNILLATRKGRCGEWANCFTLLCRAMGWDARHVFDETDHVWTEVYSFGEKRWLHCDPCENVCDTPLMYEFGWNKLVTYVMAYSGEEVQDVTWRYSSKHKEVLTRRNRCTEEELANVLAELRTERQKDLSESRRKYLSKRLLEELCQLMVEKQPSDADKKGRSSGSLSWRLSRGEQQLSSDFKPFTWKFSNGDLQGNSVNICYSTALDSYKLSSTDRSCEVEGWFNGASEVEGIFRKEEKDWKMVYIARTEKSMIGKLKWTFEVDDANKAFDVVDINFDYALYENGKVDVSLVGDSGTMKFSHGQKKMETENLSGSKKIKIIATLTGGKGDISWQHAQLFRQSADSKEYCFNVTFTFKDIQ